MNDRRGERNEIHRSLVDTVRVVEANYSRSTLIK